MTKTLPPPEYIFTCVLYQELAKRWVVVLGVDFYFFFNLLSRCFLTPLIVRRHEIFVIF